MLSKNSSFIKVTANEALLATGLPVSAATVRRLCAAGKIADAVRIGHRWYCTPLALADALVHEPKNAVRS